MLQYLNCNWKKCFNKKVIIKSKFHGLYNCLWRGLHPKAFISGKYLCHQFLQYSILKQQWILDSKTFSEWEHPLDIYAVKQIYRHLILLNGCPTLRIVFKANTQCCFSMEYWRNWWHKSLFYDSKQKKIKSKPTKHTRKQVA